MSCFARCSISTSFPVVHPDCQKVAIVAEIEEEIPRAFLHLTSQIGQHIEAVEVYGEVLVASLVAIEEFLLDIRLSGRGQKRRQHIL